MFIFERNAKLTNFSIFMSGLGQIILKVEVATNVFIPI